MLYGLASAASTCEPDKERESDCRCRGRVNSSERPVIEYQIPEDQVEIETGRNVKELAATPAEPRG